MRALPSGFPEHVSDAEDLSRFLTQSSQFNSFGAKPAAFLPNPKYRNTSVFRLGNAPELLRQTWKEIDKSGRPLKGAAICKAMVVRTARLEIMAAEPPPGHANIEGWLWIESDPELQKAQQLESAGQLAKASMVVPL